MVGERKMRRVLTSNTDRPISTTRIQATNRPKCGLNPSVTLAIATSAVIVRHAPGRPYVRAAQAAGPAHARGPPAKRERGPHGPSLGEDRARPDSLRHRIDRKRRPRLPEL